jgi:hypothetical protein
MYVIWELDFQEVGVVCKHWEHRIFLSLLLGSKPRKTLVNYGGMAEAKNWRPYCPRGKPNKIFRRHGHRIRLS